MTVAMSPRLRSASSSSSVASSSADSRSPRDSRRRDLALPGFPLGRGQTTTQQRRRAPLGHRVARGAGRASYTASSESRSRSAQPGFVRRLPMLRWPVRSPGPPESSHVFGQAVQHRPHLLRSDTLVFQAPDQSGWRPLPPRPCPRIRTADTKSAAAPSVTGTDCPPSPVGLEQDRVVVQEQGAPDGQHGDEHDHGPAASDPGPCRRGPEPRLAAPEGQPEQERPAREGQNRPTFGVGEQADQQQVDENGRGPAPRVSQGKTQQVRRHRKGVRSDDLAWIPVRST